MIGENPRLLELRRRVQADPASIAFAQLAEELRRGGANHEAVEIGRAGLQHHPDYVSVRVTLARALIELDRLGEARTELDIVLKSAPENLAANRALAEVFQKRGQLPEALQQYRKALELATFDPDIEHEVQRIENVVAPPPPAAPAPEAISPAAVEDLFDFDALLAQLGGRTQDSSKIDPPPALLPPVVPAPSPLDVVELREDAGDPFSVLERQLRDNEDQRGKEPIPTEAELHEQGILAALEDWLSAIVSDRDNRPTA